MKMVNIRVYKVILPSGKTTFEVKNSEGYRSISADSLNNIAYAARGEVWTARHEARKTSELAHVTIDLCPFHEIECPNPSSHGPDLLRCLPLSKEESDDFWAYFVEYAAMETD